MRFFQIMRDMCCKKSKEAPEVKVVLLKKDGEKDEDRKEEKKEEKKEELEDAKLKSLLDQKNELEELISLVEKPLRRASLAAWGARLTLMSVCGTSYYMYRQLSLSPEEIKSYESSSATLSKIDEHIFEAGVSAANKAYQEASLRFLVCEIGVKPSVSVLYPPPDYKNYPGEELCWRIRDYNHDQGIRLLWGSIDGSRSAFSHAYLPQTCGAATSNVSVIDLDHDGQGLCVNGTTVPEVMGSFQSTVNGDNKIFYYSQDLGARFAAQCCHLVDSLRHAYAMVPSPLTALSNLSVVTAYTPRFLSSSLSQIVMMRQLFAKAAMMATAMTGVMVGAEFLQFVRSECKKQWPSIFGCCSMKELSKKNREKIREASSRLGFDYVYDSLRNTLSNLKLKLQEINREIKAHQEAQQHVALVVAPAAPSVKRPHWVKSDFTVRAEDLKDALGSHSHAQQRAAV